MVIRYVVPKNWITYDATALVGDLTEAKAAVKSLMAMPYQRSWAEELQQVQLKHEVAGTSRIEGAEFSPDELDDAIDLGAPDDLFTRSQRQAHAGGSRRNVSVC